MQLLQKREEMVYKIAKIRESVFVSKQNIPWNDVEQYLKRYIDNFDLPQKKLIYRFKNTELIFSSSEYSECGHGINFKRYSDKNTCFICDLKTAFNGIIYG